MKLIEAVRHIPIEILLTISTGITCTTDGRAIIETIEWMVADGEALAFALPLAFTAAQTHLAGQYPDLPTATGNLLPHWIAVQKTRFGATLAVKRKGE